MILQESSRKKKVLQREPGYLRRRDLLLDARVLEPEGETRADKGPHGARLARVGADNHVEAERQHHDRQREHCEKVSGARVQLEAAAFPVLVFFHTARALFFVERARRHHR